MKDSSFTAMTSNIQVDVTPIYLEEKSDPVNQKLVYAYFVTIINHSTEPIKILARHWEIEDSDGHVLTVDGEGIVGQQPTIQPGQEHEYNSFSVLKGYKGYMSGYYVAENDNGEHVKITIPRSLLLSHLLN